MIYVILTWGFPVYLVFAELFFRFLTAQNLTAFIGPALAAAGISLMLPLLEPKSIDVPANTRRAVERRGGRIVNQRDQTLIVVVIVFILVGLGLWGLAADEAFALTRCRLGEALDTPCRGSLLYRLFGLPNEILNTPSHIVVGVVNYLAAAVLAAMKKAM